MPSVADTARANLLAALSLTSSSLSNVDLFALVKDTPGQTVWIFNTAQSVPVNYWQYLNSLNG